MTRRPTGLDYCSKQEVFGRHWEDPAWGEVLRLICGMVAERFAGELIEFLARDAYRPWPREFGERPPRNVALAVQCLGELRNPSAVHASAALLLRVLISLLEYSAGSRDDLRDVLLEREVLPAVAVIGGVWPGRDAYLSWYRARAAGLTRPPIAGYAARIAATLIPGDDEVRSLLRELIHTAEDPEVRHAGVDGLIQSWRIDPDALAVLRERATTDQYGDVRKAAVRAIGGGWPKDPDVLAWLQERAMTDELWGVRSAAVGCIGQGWPADPDALAVLEERATTDKDEAVCQAAVGAIGGGGQGIRTSWFGCGSAPAPTTARTCVGPRSGRSVGVGRGSEHPGLAAGARQRRPPRGRASGRGRGDRWGWAGDPNILVWLRERASADHREDVRRAAVGAIGGGWAGDPDILVWLRERATTDEDEAVRQSAVWAIGGGWAGDPEALAWLRASATDEHWIVRRAAVRAIAGGWPGDPETLAYLQGLSSS
jgi:hypothetical protein